MSQRDLRHVLAALVELSGAEAGVGVAVGAVSEAIGRAADDMRTPLNLQSLAAEGRAQERDDGTWALTTEGLEPA